MQPIPPPPASAARLLRAFALAGLAGVLAASLACSPTAKKRKKKETPSPTVTPTATYPYYPIVLNSFEAEPEVAFVAAPGRRRLDAFKPLKGPKPEFSWRTDRMADVERSSDQFFAPTAMPASYERPLSELMLCPPRSARAEATPIFPVHCDHSAKVHFSVPPDYLTEWRRKGASAAPPLGVGTPGSPVPLARHEAMKGAHLGFPSPTPRPTAPWIVGITYPDPAGSSELALPNGTPVHDWRPYHQLAFDVLNPAAERFEMWVRLHDGENHYADFPVSVSGTSLQKVAIPVEAMRLASARDASGHTENARLQVDDIRLLSLMADTSAFPKDRVLYVDALRLELVPATASPTPSKSPWSFRRDVLGIGKPTPTRTPLPEGEEPPEEETPEEEVPEEGAEGEETPAG